MRVILAGGGTGGHLFPGLAVAREFQRRDAMTEILFVGTEQGIEARVLPQEGFKLETLSVKGLRGRGLRGFLDALYGVPASLLRSLRLIREFRPDLIIGLGGYASGPLLLAGKIKGIRCAIMEQNLRPGFTNKILARLMDRVFTAYQESAGYFPGARVRETGNPVRWRKLPEVKKGEKFTLLIFGGSAGAHRINVAVVDALEKLTDMAPKLHVIHQTGQADFAVTKEAFLSKRKSRRSSTRWMRPMPGPTWCCVVLARLPSRNLPLSARPRFSCLIPMPFTIINVGTPKRFKTAARRR